MRKLEYVHPQLPSMVKGCLGGTWWLNSQVLSTPPTLWQNILEAWGWPFNNKVPAPSSETTQAEHRYLHSLPWSLFSYRCKTEASRDEAICHMVTERSATTSRALDSLHFQFTNCHYIRLISFHFSPLEIPTALVFTQKKAVHWLTSMGISGTWLWNWTCYILSFYSFYFSWQIMTFQGSNEFSCTCEVAFLILLVLLSWLWVDLFWLEESSQLMSLVRVDNHSWLSITPSPFKPFYLKQLSQSTIHSPPDTTPTHSFSETASFRNFSLPTSKIRLNGLHCWNSIQ